MDQDLTDCQTHTTKRVLVKRGKATVAETEVFVAEPGVKRVLVRRVLAGLPLAQFGALVPEHLVDGLQIFLFFLHGLELFSEG